MTPYSAHCGRALQLRVAESDWSREKRGAGWSVLLCLGVLSRVVASAAAGRQKVGRQLARYSFSAPVLNLDPPVKDDRRLGDGWTLVWISRIPFGHISACSF